MIERGLLLSVFVSLFLFSLPPSGLFLREDRQPIPLGARALLQVSLSSSVEEGERERFSAARKRKKSSFS